MTQRRNEEFEAIDGPEEAVFPGAEDRAVAAHELHRRRTAAWVAAGGTFLVIVALWAMLLPTQFGGLSGFGFKSAADWQSFRSDAAAQAPAFQESVKGMQRQLDAADAQRKEASQRAAAEQDAASLRAKIETSTSQPSAADGTNAAATNQPKPKSP